MKQALPGKLAKLITNYIIRYPWSWMNKHMQNLCLCTYNYLPTLPENRKLVY